MKSATSLGKREIRVAINPQSVCRMAVYGTSVNQASHSKRGESRSSKVVRFIGNFDVDYRLHFFPDLKLHATLGYDYAEGKGSEYVSPEAAQYYTTGGYYYPYGPQKNENRLLTLYANYNKFVDTLNSSFDATVGYDYQYWKSATPATTQMSAAVS